MMDRALRLERTALVIDDDAFVASMLAEVLSEAGYDVHTASNGFSAVRLAHTSRPALVLLDLALPELSGAEVLAELRGDAATRDVAIVVVTADARVLTAAQIAETDGVVLKPFDVAELVEAVHIALQRATQRQAEVAPVAATSHRDLAARARGAAGARRSRGRR
jgi:DNA-binding response OmpR family regulator